MPAGYVSHTGYQYDSISRVAGQRELAPPSKFLKLGGFNRSVFITEVKDRSSLQVCEGTTKTRRHKETPRIKSVDAAFLCVFVSLWFPYQPGTHFTGITA